MNQLDKGCSRLFATNCNATEWTDGLQLLSNWRASHSYPLNALNTTLRNRVLSVDQTAITAQRLKRLDSVLRKLRRRPTMQMSQMQDVGGCRAVVGGMKNLGEVLRMYVDRPLKHTLHKVDNYIDNPKSDGYRSIHMRYRFAGRATASPWNNLRIEVQIRTKLQHSWATAVETIDAFTGENIKFGVGTEKWRRFFALMGSVHALYERQTPVPLTPLDTKELREELAELSASLNVPYMLRSYARIGKQVQGYKNGKDYWYLLELMPSTSEVRMTSYPTRMSDQAKTDYAEAEMRFSNSLNQAVLVSVDSIKDLQKAYPNFFGDTRLFLSSLERFLSDNNLPRNKMFPNV
nr:RelA/SpoT domain-containing protein [Rhizobium sp. Root1204]